MSKSSKSRIDQAYSLFFKAMIQGGVKPLAISAHELLQWPVAIMDHVSNSLCQVPNKELGIPDWDELLELHSSRPEHYMDFYKKYLSNPETRNYPLIIEDGYLSKTKQLLSTYFVKGKPAGTVVIHINDREVTEEDIEIVRLLCLSLGSEVSKLEEMERFFNKRNLLRFKNVLEANPGSPAIAKDIEILEKDYSKDYFLIVSRYAGNSNDYRILELACNDIMKSHKNILSIYKGEYVVTLCSCIDRNTTASCCNLTVHNVLDTLSKYTMSSGISAPFHNLVQVKAFYEQAILSLKLGYHIAPEKMVYSFDEYAPLHLFVPAVEKYPLETFLHPLIHNISHYDKKYNTDYLKTLEAYILSSLNTGIAARNLSVHHNTLLYRINRMKELFKIDFKDTNLITTLLCNFLLMKVGGYLRYNYIEDIIFS